MRFLIIKVKRTGEKNLQVSTVFAWIVNNDYARDWKTITKSKAILDELQFELSTARVFLTQVICDIFPHIVHPLLSTASELTET